MNHAATLRLMRDITVRSRIKARVAAAAKRSAGCDCPVCLIQRAIRGVVPEDVTVEVSDGLPLAQAVPVGRKH